MIQIQKHKSVQHISATRDDKIVDNTGIVKENAGNVEIFKCKKCPYIALSNKDINFHWQTLHIPSESEHKKKEAVSVTIKCPGCSGLFYSQSTLMVHLRSHHKMAPKDILKLAIGLTKEAERNKEYIEKLDVVIGNFKYEDQVAFEGNIIPAVIEIPPDPGFKKDSAKQGVQILNVMNIDSLQTKPVDINTDFMYRQKNSFKRHDIENVSVPNTPCTDGNYKIFEDDVQIQKNIEYTNELLNNSLKLPHKAKKRKNISKNKTKAMKKGRPFGAKSIGISKNKNPDGEILRKQFGDKCSIQGCGVRLISNEKMTYHKSCHFNNNFELFCPECRKQCQTVESLHLHLWHQHKIDMELQSCDRCPYKTFKKRLLINTHKKIHSDEKTFKCDICYKDFKNSKQLCNHRLIHKEKDSEKYVCSICNRKLKNQRLLLQHIQAVHEKTANFQCQLCQYSAATKHSLKLHLLTHTGEKPFECDQCTFKTSIKSSLRRHIQIHTQNRKYNCEHCSYSCIQASSFKIHITSKHPGVSSNLIHLCPMCPYKSVNKANFTTHISKHDLEDVRKNNADHLLGGDSLDKLEKLTQPIHSKIIPENKTEVTPTGGLNTVLSEAHNGIKYDDQVFQLDLTQQSNILHSDNYYNSSDVINDKMANSIIYSNCSPHDNVIKKNNGIFVKDMFDLATNNIQSNLTGDLLQSSINKAFLPIVLVNPKTQNPSETDDWNSQNLGNYSSHGVTPQLIHLPLQNMPSDSLNNDAPLRKKPKISVKSNLILKGPDKVDTFDLQKCNKSQSDLDLDNLPYSIENQNSSIPYDVTMNNISQDSDVLPVSKLILRDPFMSDYSTFPNYLLSSNFFSNLPQMQSVSNNTPLIQPQAVSGITKVSNNNMAMSMDSNPTSDLSDIKLENKPYISLQSELSCTSLNDTVSGNSSLIYEIPKHTIPIKYENKLDILSTSLYQDDLLQNVNALAQMQNVSIIEELPASFENSEDIMDTQLAHQYEDNSYSPNGNLTEIFDDNEIIVIDDASCEMKSVPNFGEESDCSFVETAPYYDGYNIRMPLPVIHNSNQNNSNGKPIKEKPRIISEVHISSDKSKIMNFAAVKNLGLKLEFPSIQNIEWTLKLLNNNEKRDNI